MLAEVLAACRRLGLLEEGVHFADSLHEMPGVGAHLQFDRVEVRVSCGFSKPCSPKGLKDTVR